jgi:hypothetical protein
MSVTVSISGNTSPTITATTGDTINVTVSPAGAVGPQGVQGVAGPANSLSIGTVTSGTAAATITGTAPTQTLNLVLPAGSAGATGSKGDTGSQGPVGPANSLSVGTVTSGTAAATITGTAPSQVLNLVLQKGDTGAQGPAGPTGPAVNLADETPQPLGTASAGTALAAARADHVHAVGSITYSSLSGIPSTFAPSAHAHAVSDVAGLQTALDGKQASGNYATLVGGTVPSSQLPSYVDDVIEYANLAAFTEQSTGKIYVARDTGKIYRWSGSAYVEISPSPGSTDSVTEGSTNLYYTNARAAAASPVQSVASRTGAVTLTKSDVGLGNVTNVDATARSSHTGTQAASTISDFATEAAKYGPVTSVSGRTGTIALTKSDVGLGNVPNTDATARSNHTGTQLASSISDFAIEAAKYGPVVSVSGRTGTVTLTKSDVGLGNVDNTADTAKPISTAMQAALDGKAATSHTHSLSSLTQSSATTGQVPTWNGSAWAAATPSAGGVTSVNGQTGDVTVSGGSSYTLPAATDAVLGGVKVGTGLAISSGVLSATGGGSYTLPTATDSVLGGIKVGANLTITDGVLAATGGGGSANIVEATTAASFPATGASGTLYMATDASRVYRYSGSVYVEIGPK